VVVNGELIQCSHAVSIRLANGRRWIFRDKKPDDKQARNGYEHHSVDHDRVLSAWVVWFLNAAQVISEP
jgi:hypothetical protein